MLVLLVGCTCWLYMVVVHGGCAWWLYVGCTCWLYMLVVLVGCTWWLYMVVVHGGCTWWLYMLVVLVVSLPVPTTTMKLQAFVFDVCLQ